MKNTLLLCFAIACIGSFASCECNNVDCAIDERVFFHFLSQTDSTDLIINGSYPLTSLTITEKLVNNENPGSSITIAPSGDEYIASVSAHPNVDSFIIQLGSLKPDTLTITSILSEGDKCCPGILEFETLQLNGKSLSNDFANATIQLYK